MTDQGLLQRYLQTRQASLKACETLLPEDFGLQAEPFTSPPKWHLAHTSWFFETFLLKPFLQGYCSPDDRYQHLFNSYYNGVGEPFPRANRGLLSRPTVDQVIAYRGHVDSAMNTLLSAREHSQRQEILTRSRLGIEHEQQHQELFFTDLKYSLFANPLYPGYGDAKQNQGPVEQGAAPCADIQWREYPGGLVAVGTDARMSNEIDFAFDNEGPAHSVYLYPFALANRLVTNKEFQDFIDDGGYQRHEFWLADGWTIVAQQDWRMPLYWLDIDGEPMQFTLQGLQNRHAQQPVCHLSGYEADAYASWANARLPTEFEWECAAAATPEPKLHASKLHPEPASGNAPLLQLYDDCWQWTSSAYNSYPGFQVSEGAIGEYNGKFMANQWVLRGGSCVSQPGHVRPTYRNFFYPQDRWQFTGLRLAKDL